MDEHLRNRVFTFLNTLNPKVCAIATVSSPGMAHCAVMGYVVLPDFSLVLNTHLHTRKWTNLSNNPKVALTFGWSLENAYLQYEGSAELIFSGEKHFRYEKLYFAEHTDAIKYKAQGETGTIRIKPLWFRFYDFTVDPTQVHEVSFDTGSPIALGSLRVYAN